MQIGRITTKGKVATFPITGGSAPAQIVTDGKVLYFTDFDANAIGRITTKGKIALYPVPTPSGQPLGIADAGGNVLFTEETSSKIGRYRP